MKLTSFRGVTFLLLIVTLLSGCSTKNAGSYYKEGIKNFKNKDYEKAEENLQKALELNGERAEYYIDYGMTLVMLGEFDTAVKYFDRAILDKDNSIAKKNNKIALRGKGINHYMSYDYINAIAEFEKALAIKELDDLDTDILYYIGSAQTKAGLYEKAVATFTKILDKKPSDAATYNERAFAYGKLSDFENGLKDCDKAIGLDKHNYDYYFGKYFLLLDKGDITGANGVLEEAENLEIVTKEDSFNLAKVHYYMEAYEEAKVEFSEAGRSGFVNSYLYLGSIYKIAGDYETAIFNYKQFVDNETSEKSATVYNQLGVCYLELEQYKEALDSLQTGMKYNDIFIDGSLRRNLIIALEGLGQYDEAYKQMKEYLKLYKGDTEAEREMEYIKTRIKSN
jgi:tetratricopeptide (TPR) repeat protein